jgi:hypothetical protein
MLRRFRCLALFLAVFQAASGCAQTEDDTLINVYQLGPLVIHGRTGGLDLEGFMRQVKEDTSFLHAFLNMRYWPHTVEGTLTVRNKGEQDKAGLFRRGRLVRNGPMASLPLDSVAEHGKLRARNGDMRYLTAELYDDLFWPRGTWHADNSIATYRNAKRGGGRIATYKERLKQFMFNPGEEIDGLPFIGNKLALFSPEMAPYYNYMLESEHRNGYSCWLFSATAKDSLNGKSADADATVIKRMRTWFDQGTMQVIAREYRIAHASMILDFDIRIRVECTRMGGELVPTFIHYDGDWDIPFHKRELVRFQLNLGGWEVQD